MIFLPFTFFDSLAPLVLTFSLSAARGAKGVLRQFRSLSGSVGAFSVALIPGSALERARERQRQRETDRQTERE